MGTTWLSDKSEWALFLKLVNGLIDRDKYEKTIEAMNPPPAIGLASTFRDQYASIIDFIKSMNSEAIILVSAIIPRPWDHDRRNLVRMSYNMILENFNNPPSKVFFIHSYKPFLANSSAINEHLFNPDGIHLNVQGSAVLRGFLCEKIDKAKMGLLK